MLKHEDTVASRNRDGATRTALAELGLTVDIDKVTDPAEIVAWGVMSTPALVIDDEVVLSGRVPTARQLGELLATRS